MAKRKGKPSEKWGGGGFAAVPHRVLDSPKFGKLSPNATKLLMDLVAQYRGRNNGDLCAAMTLLKERGWNSNATLQKARDELLAAGFIVVSEQGGRNKPTLYALTFYAVDECLDKRGNSKHSLKPTISPTNDFLRGTLPPDIKAAQQRKKQADIIDLKEHLKANPNDKYAPNYRKAIDELEARQK